MRRELSSARYQIESTEDEVNQTVLKTVKVECRIKKNTIIKQKLSHLFQVKDLRRNLKYEKDKRAEVQQKVLLLAHENEELQKRVKTVVFLTFFSG